MADLEHPIQQRILLACGSGDRRLWRNNVGTGWAGKSKRVTAGNLRAVAVGLRPGDVVIRAARPLHAGLCVGSSDLIGLRSLEITPELVGQRLAQFVALEVKTASGVVSPKQRAFLRLAQELGGVAAVCRSVEEAEQLLSTPRQVLLGH